MTINIRASFMQPLVAATASSVVARLQPLLHEVHAAGGLYAGDVIVCGDMYFRIAQRIWHGDRNELRLEIVLQHESWYREAAERDTRDHVPGRRQVGAPSA